MALQTGRGLMTLLLNFGTRTSWGIRLCVSRTFTRSSSTGITYVSGTKLGMNIQKRMKQTGFNTDNGTDELQVDSYAEYFTDDSITNIASDILAKASTKDVMVKAVTIAAVKAYVKELLLVGWTPAMVKEVFISCPNFLTQSKQKTSKVLELLTAHGFSNEQIAMLMSSGVMVSLTDKSFSESMSTLRKIGVEDQELQRLVSFFPDVLLLNSRSVEQRVTDLKAMFKADDIVPIIFRSPNILFDEWGIIHQKFHYVFWVMGIKQRQMVSSQLFSHSQEYIMIRHKFVERTGFYSKPRDKDEYLRRTNPKLREILDTSDEKFAQMFGGMTTQDYKAFYDMLEREINSQMSEEDYDDMSD